MQLKKSEDFHFPREGKLLRFPDLMISEDDFQYAVENTEVILAPQRKIDTFGETSFRFFVVAELMDRANEVRVREGRLHAGKPQIVTPENLSRLLLEGFGEEAHRYLEWMREHGRGMAFLKYGFQFRKTEVVESLAHNSLEEVLATVRASVDTTAEPLTTIIRGVDDAWEVCLLKFSLDLIRQSAQRNFGDFKNRGLL